MDKLPLLPVFPLDAFSVIKRITINEAVDACNPIAEQHGYVFVRGGGDGKKRIILLCDCHGTPGKLKPGDAVPEGLRASCSKKCRCLFRLQIYGNRRGDVRRYMVEVVHFEHNHAPQSILLTAHAHARRHASAGNKNTTSYTGVGVPTDTIFQQVVNHESLNIPKDVHNAAAKQRKEFLGGRQPHMALLEKLEHGEYEYAFTTDDANNKL